MINQEPISCIYCIFQFYRGASEVATWNVANAVPTISPSHWLSALASFVDYYQVARAAARRLVADGGRQ